MTFKLPTAARSARILRDAGSLLFFVHVVASAPVARAETTSYLGATPLDATQFVSAPPRMRSLQQQADLAAVRAWQDEKGRERWRQAQADDDLSPYAAFQSVLGRGFTADRAPKTKALFDVLFADVKSVTAPAKVAFARSRPPLVDASLSTCMPLEKTPSYPSGHAARGWLMALVLSEMAPEYANRLLARGLAYGDSRVVCAEHFPSDVEAGRLIGAAVAASAGQNPAFRRALADARTELRAALGLPKSGGRVIARR